MSTSDDHNYAGRATASPSLTLYALGLASAASNTVNAPLLPSPSSHHPASQHVIDTHPGAPPPPLLDLIPPLRSLVWQCMDNRSAVHYLTSCKQLHALYESFPLTEPVTGKQWLRLISTASNLPSPERTHSGPSDDDMRHPFSHHSKLPRSMPLPCIIRLAGWCTTPRQVTYLQHVVKASISDSDFHLISRSEWTLPHSLRQLQLMLHDYRQLQLNTLPPQLTLLLLHEVDAAVLQPGALPHSLTALALYYKQAVRESTDPSTSMQRIAPGVLPSQLQRLEIIWTRSLADLALPASLIRLDLFVLSNLPIPPNCLPAGLRTLRILTPKFDPDHLRGALPSSMRVLRLSCAFSRPLTRELLAEVPVLEELDVTYQHRLSAGLLTPLTQLRVLRLCILRLNRYRHPIAAGELPASLQRLILDVAGEQSEKESVAVELVPLAVRHAVLVVEFQSEPDPFPLLITEFAGRASVRVELSPHAG